MKKIYVSIFAAALSVTAGFAQDNLQKEITLPKDFVPVVKKPVKKSALPRVLKPVVGSQKSEIDFSDWAEPTAVSVEIPTMLPYGYRTSHRFSSQRGYLDAGAGTQLNMVGSLGYRLVDSESLKFDAWAQHNSTWSGRNTNPERNAKQKFCDNVVGLDLAKTFGAGELNLGAKVHFDRFNYYGAPIEEIDATQDKNNFWFGHDQSFTDVAVKGSWKSRVNVSKFHDVSYMVNVGYNYAGYDYGYLQSTATYYPDFKGAKEHYFQAGLGVKYALEANSSLGMNVNLDALSRSSYVMTDEVLGVVGKATDRATMVTLAPFYTYYGQNLLARLGANVNISFSDGATLRLSPNVHLAYEFTPGVSIYANAEGGKRFNTLSRVAAINRYLDPNGRYGNTFVPLDAEAGFKIGPFSGLTVKALVGYGVFKDNLATMSNGWDANAMLTNIDCKGVKAGAQVDYKLRSLAEVNLAFTYAPQSDEFNLNKSYSGYMLGLDRAKMVASADLHLYLFKGFTISAGLEYRGKRHYFDLTDLSSDPTVTMPMVLVKDLKNVMNLHAGASYRFDKVLTIWVKGTNLLNKQWDVLYTQGAQKLGIMGGIGLVF